MRFLKFCVYRLLALVLPLAVADPAAAQLFSWGNSKPKGPARYSTAPVASQPGYSRPGASLFSRYNPFGLRSYRVASGGGSPAQAGRYRTMCVRLCDGYYFPVSERTTRNGLHRDAKICEASCDCDARLFYLPGSSSDIENMTDLSGLSYENLEQAFKYRTQWDESCSCRPPPWTYAAQMRHSEYEQEAAAARARNEDAQLTKLAHQQLAGMKKNEPIAPQMSNLEVAAAQNAGTARDHNTAAAFERVEPESILETQADTSHSMLPPGVKTAASTEAEKPTTVRRIKTRARRAQAQLQSKKPAGRGLFQF